MKKPSQTILLLLIFAALAMAGTTTVDFTSLALPVNINGIPTSVTGVGFQYEPGGSLNNPPPSNCNFDAGLGGTQFFDFVNFPGGCVGAQVDSITGLSGTTDGSYALSFSSQVWNLHLVYGMLSLLTPAPLDTDYALNAILFDGPNMVGIAGAVGPGGTLDTASFYTGPFTSAILTFEPATPLDASLVPQAAYGLTYAQVSEVTFSTPEPDALWLFLIGLVGMGANRLVRRRA